MAKEQGAMDQQQGVLDRFPIVFAKFSGYGYSLIKLGEVVFAGTSTIRFWNFPQSYP